MQELLTHVKSKDFKENFNLLQLWSNFEILRSWNMMTSQQFSLTGQETQSSQTVGKKSKIICKRKQK